MSDADRFRIGTANGECEILETVNGGTRCIAKCYYYQQADRIIHALRAAESVPPEERRMPAEPTMGMWDDFMEEWQNHPNDFEAFLHAYRVMYANYQRGPQEGSPE